MPTTSRDQTTTTTAGPDPGDDAEPRSRAATWIETLVTVAAAIGLAFVIQLLLVKPFKVPTPSMLPTIHEGQRILANRIGNRFGDPKDGEIVVFSPPADAESVDPTQQCAAPHPATQPCLRANAGRLHKQYVKRVVGVGGDRLQIVHGHVIRNGRAVREPYARTCDGQGCNLRPFTVPADTYFMMGDNRGNSLDSRYWGPLPRKLVIGRAFATYWPPNQIGGL